MACSLHADSCLYVLGYHAVAVFLALSLKELHAGHRDDSCLYAVCLEQFLCVHAQFYFRTRGNEQYVGLTLAVVEHVCALERLQSRIFICGQILSGLDYDGGIFCGECRNICRRGLPAVAGTEYVDVGQRAHHYQLLHGLMGGAVLAYAYGIVRHYICYGQTHKRAHSDACLHVVDEGEEGRADCAQTAVNLNAVAYCRHCMFPYAELNVAALSVFGREVFAALYFRLGGGGKVGRAGHEVGRNLGYKVDYLAAAASGCLGLVKVGKSVYCVEVGGCAAHELLVLRCKQGIVALIGSKECVPALFCRAFFLGYCKAVRLYFVGNFEGFARPAEVFLCLCKVALAEGSAVAGSRVLEGGTVSYLGFAYYERGARKVALCALDCNLKRSKIGCVVYAYNLPALSYEARCYVLAESRLYVALYGYVVAVVQEYELAELLGACKGARLIAYALLKAAVTAEHIGVVVDYVIAGLVEKGGKVSFRNRHADGVGNALAEGTGGGLYAVRPAVFGVSGRSGAELTESHKVFLGHVIAEEVQKRIEHCRAVTCRKNESVAVVPLGVFVAVIEKVCE